MRTYQITTPKAQFTVMALSIFAALLVLISQGAIKKNEAVKVREL